MNIHKVCGMCGTLYNVLPEQAVLQAGMFWWNCQCGSTLAYTQPKLELVETIPDARKERNDNVKKLYNLPIRKRTDRNNKE